VTGAAGIANPVSRAVECPDDVRRFLDEVGAPVILKPANRQASVGTRVLGEASDVASAWETCRDVDEGMYIPDRGVGTSMLVESFVAGDELSVEMLVHDGVPLFSNVTAKRLFPGPHPVELGHTVPAEIPDAQAQRLVDDTIRVLEAVGFRTGFVHCEWIVPVGAEPHLVECAGRMPGDLIVPLINHAYGMDVVHAYLDVMRGIVPEAPLPRRAVRRTAIEFLAAVPGRVVRVDGMEQARGLPGVISVDLSPRPGDEVGELRCSWDRVGSVAAAAPTTAEAMRRARQGVERLVVETAVVIHRRSTGQPSYEGED
jgi:biotin carboxylase